MMEVLWPPYKNNDNSLNCWGGLSSADKLGNKDKSFCRHCKWRLYKSSTRKQAIIVIDNVLGATAEKY